MFESVVILPTCGSRLVHEPHSWRHGFLHLRKTRCGGMSLADYSTYREAMDARERRAQQTLFPKHKHSFKFIGADEGDLVFRCKNPKCQTYCHWSRWVFDFRTLNSPEDFGLFKGRGWCGRRDMHFAHRYDIVNNGDVITYSHCHGLTDKVAKYFSGSMT